jgi:glucosyl-3-phosphoglycerate phosphatase
VTDRRRVVLWRHGRTAWNTEQRHQGHTDVPLDEVGRAQAVAAAPGVAALGPSALVSSDLRRATQTAEALTGLTGLAATHDPGLRERHGGAWQGLTDTEVADRYPDAHARWRAGADVRPPDGESMAEAAVRAVEALEKALAPLPAGATLVAVTHGAVVRGVIGSALGLPAGAWVHLGGLANCAYAVLEAREPGWRLLAHNVDASLARPGRAERLASGG